MKLINMNEMLKKAYKGKYAVPHINTNQLRINKSNFRSSTTRKFAYHYRSFNGSYKIYGWC